MRRASRGSRSSFPSSPHLPLAGSLSRTPSSSSASQRGSTPHVDIARAKELGGQAGGEIFGIRIKSRMTRTRTGGEWVVEALRAEGVRHVFGSMGGGLGLEFNNWNLLA